jgi:S-adenosylmethionine hydrolase
MNMKLPTAPITLLTDFGTRDQYVAEMKGVILQIAPRVAVVDITHEIDPQDVIRAAFVLRQVWNWFPPGTVHLAVVDPGVGSRRRIIAGRYAGQYVICPDNGLISMVHHQLRVEAVHAVDNRNYMLQTVSGTFHGRDIMAPVAARLAGGLPIGEVGPPIDRVEILQLALPQQLPGPGLAGEVLCADRFGNLVTNIQRQALMTLYRQRSDLEVHLDGHCLGPIRTGYHEVPAGEPVALIGSADYLEIAVNCGNASQKLAAGRGSKVEVR